MGEKPGRGDSWADRILAKAQSGLGGGGHSRERTDEYGIFGRVIGPPPGRDGEIAEALRAGGAGTIRVAPFQERRIHPKQEIPPERQIDPGHGIDGLRAP